MDQLLEGLFNCQCQHSDKQKQGIIARICEQGTKRIHTERDVRGVLQVSCKWILNGASMLQRSSGLNLFNVWGTFHPVVFQSYFNPTLVAQILTQSAWNPTNVPLLLREGDEENVHSLKPQMEEVNKSSGFLVMNCNGISRNYYNCAQMVQRNIVGFVESRLKHAVVHNVGLLLEEFTECIPSDEKAVYAYCLAVLNYLSFAVFFPGAEEIKLITSIDEIARSLSAVWRLRSQGLPVVSLCKIFTIISVPRAENQAEGSIFLAALVKHIPMESVNIFVKDMVTNRATREESVSAAVGQIVEWLKWPTAQNVDGWLLCFFTELEGAQKYTLLTYIMDANIEQIVENLTRPHLRQASFIVLSRMLLGFQHSPGPFHKCLEKLPFIIQKLREENTIQSGAYLFQLSQLIYCLMYQHPGFPGLYDPILELIKEFPQPKTQQIQIVLRQSKWSTKSTCSAVADTNIWPITSIRQEKLEPGKTGLRNLGNTCYMNSVIQALYMCDQFRRGVLVATPQEPKEDLFLKLQQVFAFLSQSDRPAITPTKFLQASRPPWFLPGHQQDCSEFLKYLLNQLHEDEKSSHQWDVQKKPSCLSILSDGSIRINMNANCSMPHRKKSAVMLTAVKMKTEEEMNSLNSSAGCSSDSGKISESVKSLVEKTFAGKVQTTLMCLGCKQESLTVESFVDMPLAFPNSFKPTEYPYKSLAGGGGVPSSETDAESMQIAEAELTNSSEDHFSLNDLISFYLKPEKLTGDNKYYCNKCGTLQDGEKSIKIVESPQYLIITLLRFSYDTMLQTRTKISQDVKYPRTLSVPVCGESTSSKDIKLCPQQQHLGSNSCSSSRGGLITANSYLTKLEEIARRLAPKYQQSKQEHQYCQLYSLSGVIVHSGTSSECGHYYCYARHSQDGQMDTGLLDNLNDNVENIDFFPDKWYNFNDSRVSGATFDSFSNVTKRFSKDTAYVLIYRRLNTGGDGQGLDTDPVLRPDLRDLVIKDNEAYHQEQEILRVKQEQRRHRISIYPVNHCARRGKDNDEDDNPYGRYHGCRDRRWQGRSGSKPIF